MAIGKKAAQVKRNRDQQPPGISHAGTLSGVEPDAHPRPAGRPRRARAVPAGNQGPAASPAEAPPPGVGNHLRRIRLERGYPLARLAEAAGVSIGLISQIERGLTSPSVRSLRQICGALGLPLSSVFQDAEQPESSDGDLVMRPAARRILDLSYKGVLKQMLTPSHASTLEMMFVHIAPGGSSGPDFYTHKGIECGFVMTGTVELYIEQEKYLLAQGDSFRFHSHIPHRFANPGRIEAVVLWVTSTVGK